MRSAFLLGRHHQRIGAVDLVAEGACAIALSRGGAAKRYDFTEPNEDACAFATAATGSVLAVADGLHGAGGSERAIEHVLAAAPAWLANEPGRAAELSGALRRLLGEIGRAIFDDAARAGLPPAATTLAIAVVRPGDDLLALASVGDSHIFVTRDGAVRDQSWSGGGGRYPEYLGRERELEAEDKYTVESIALGGARAIALVTDGFSESGIGHADPAAQLQTLQLDTLAGDWELRAPDTCRAVVESALGVQRRQRSGDNVACATWIAGRPD